jgi:hypothetical protein
MATSQEKGASDGHTQVKRWRGRRLIAENHCAPFFRFIVVLGGVRGLRPSPAMDRPRLARRKTTHTLEVLNAPSRAFLLPARVPHVLKEVRPFSAPLDQLGQFFSGIEHTCFYSRGRHVENVRYVVD